MSYGFWGPKFKAHTQREVQGSLMVDKCLFPEHTSTQNKRIFKTSVHHKLCPQNTQLPKGNQGVSFRK